MQQNKIFCCIISGLLENSYLKYALAIFVNVSYKPKKKVQNVLLGMNDNKKKHFQFHFKGLHFSSEIVIKV